MECVKKCLQDKCPLWMKLTANNKDGKEEEIGKCSFAWLPTLLIELRQEIAKTKNSTDENKQ